MKILLVRFSSIGDIVLVTPLIRTIKNLYTDSKIYILIKKEYFELLKYNKNLDGIISLESGRLVNAINRVNLEKFDIILDLHNNIKSNLIKIFCRGKLKITYKKEILERRFLVLNSFIKRRLKTKGSISNPKLIVLKYGDLKNIVHTTDRYFFAALNLIGESVKISRDKYEMKRPEIILTNKEKEFALKFLEENKIKNGDILVGFNPGGKNITKRWDPEQYTELAKKIIEGFNAKIIIFGDKNDTGVANCIEKTVNSNNVINVAGKTGLLELSGLIKKCKLLVTGDTGPMHIANSFDVPVVAIFGPTVVQFGFYPSGINDVVLCLDLYCRPCSLHGNMKCPIGTHDCMKKINADDVFKVVIEKINSCLKAP